MNKRYDFSQWQKLTQLELNIITNEIIPRTFGEKLRPRIQFAVLFLKIPLQIFFVVYQIEEIANRNIDSYYYTTTIIVDIFEAVLVFMSFMGMFIYLFASYFTIPAHYPETLNQAYTQCFLCSRISVLMLLPYVSIRQLPTSFNALIGKIQDNYENAQNNGKILGLFYSFVLLILFIGLTTFWWMIPASILIKLRQMAFVTEDKSPWEWDWQDQLYFLGFLNQLSSMCETVELPQVFLGQYFYSQTAINKNADKRFMCFGKDSCNNKICNYVSSLLAVEKTMGSIFQYGPGIHWLRTRIIAALYDEFSKANSGVRFPAINAIAVLNGLKFGDYCRIFRERLKVGGIEP